jgi:hypothetical protein
MEEKERYLINILDLKIIEWILIVITLIGSIGTFIYLKTLDTSSIGIMLIWVSIFFSSLSSILTKYRILKRLCMLFSLASAFTSLVLLVKIVK